MAQANDSAEVNLEDVQSSGRPFLKSGSYTIRCIGCTKQTSKKGNPMLVFEYEICSPDTVTDATGKDVKITGLKTTEWVTLNDMGFPKLKALHGALKLPMSVNKVTPNTKQYLGKAVKVSLKTEPSVLKDDNTGEPILDDKGEPTTMNNYRISRYNGADLEHTVAAEAIAAF